MKRKVLIIDDEVDLVDLIKLRLEAHNFFVEPLYTSARAMEITKRERPNLVLMDVMMPDKDGYEVCKELKADKETRHIPVILFTAKDQEKKRIGEDYETVGAEDYIIKPFEPADLLIKIEKLLSKED